MPAGSVWGRSHLERGTSRYNGNEQKHMPVNAVMPNPLRQPRATMSLLVPLSSALGLPRKCLVWPPLTFFFCGWGDQERFIYQCEAWKATKHESTIALEFLFLLFKNWPWFSFRYFPSLAKTKSFKGEWDQEKKRGSLKNERWSVKREWMKLKTYSSLHSITRGGKLSHKCSTDWPFNNHVHMSYGAKLDLAHLTKTSLIFNLLGEDCFKLLFQYT